jgi:hypothetical protein
MDSFLADLLDLALCTKNADLENFCVSQIPIKFSPNRFRQGGCAAGYFSFLLFIRAFLNGNEAEKEKYVHESLRQFLGKLDYECIYSIKNRADEVEEILKEKRPVIFKELLFEYLKKDAQNELFELLSNTEFDWETADAPTIGPADADGVCYMIYLTTFTLKVPAAYLEKITDNMKRQIEKILLEARAVTGLYPDSSINFIRRTV